MWKTSAEPPGAAHGGHISDAIGVRPGEWAQETPGGQQGPDKGHVTLSWCQNQGPALWFAQNPLNLT